MSLRSCVSISRVILLGTYHCMMKLKVFQVYEPNLGFTCDSCIPIFCRYWSYSQLFCANEKIILSMDVGKVLVLFQAIFSI